MGLFRRRPKRNLEAGFWCVEADDGRGKSKLDSRCTFDIVGESHHKTELGSLTILGKQLAVVEDGWTKLGVHFWLVRDPHNKHDKNAIAVYASRPDRYDHTTAALVGHLSREWAARYAQDIVQPVPVRGVIVGREDRLGVKLDVGDMTAAGLSYKQLRVRGHETVVRSLVRRARKRGRGSGEWVSAKGPAARLRHAPTPGDPNAVEVVTIKNDEVAGTVDPREKLWGPNVDGLDAELTLTWYRCHDDHDRDDDEDYHWEDDFEVEALARLPGNAREASDWTCGPYCAQIAKTDEGRFQAVGRLLHTRFKVPTCDASKQAFREAKELNAALQ